MDFFHQTLVQVLIRVLSNVCKMSYKMGSAIILNLWTLHSCMNCFHQTLVQVLNIWGLSGRVLDSRPRGRGFEPHRRHCTVSLSKNINPSLVLVQPRKARPFITKRLWIGRKESNQTKSISNMDFMSRFIANSSACTTTELSILLTSCLTAIKNHVV